MLIINFFQNPNIANIQQAQSQQIKPALVTTRNTKNNQATPTPPTQETIDDPTPSPSLKSPTPQPSESPGNHQESQCIDEDPEGDTQDESMIAPQPSPIKNKRPVKYKVINSSSLSLRSSLK